MTRFFAALLSLLLVSCAFADVVYYENQTVQSIVVQSGDNGSAPQQLVDSVKARLKTRVGFPFSQVTFDEDLKTLAHELDWVEPTVEVVNGGIELTLTVWERPMIRSIRFYGNQNAADSELLSELDICEATIFDRNAFVKAFRKLKPYYIKMGYFEADVSYNIVRDPCGTEVDIEIFVKEGRSGRIKHIYFCGFEDEEMYEIMELMVTKRWDIFTGVFGNGGNYNEEMVQYDQFQIINYLQNRGYADARVSIDVSEDRKPCWLSICITADKGDRYRFGKVTYKGNCIFNDEIIEKLIYPEEGAIFAPDAVRDTIKDIQDAYGVRGHIEAVIDDDLNLHADCPIYDVHFEIDEGEPYRVGLIKVFGNNYTLTRVILHETLLRPGEVFNTVKLRFTEERLRNIGYFKRVNVYGVRSSGESCLGDNYRDIHIEVEEGPTGNLGAFLGMSTGSDFFGGFNITEKNFRIAGLAPSSIKKYGWRGLKGDGEYAHFTATLGQKTDSYVLSWTKPYFYDTPWAVGIDLDRSFNGALSQDYDIISYGISVHAKRALNAFVLAGVNYRIRNSNVYADSELKNTTEFEREKGRQGLISAIGASISYNSTNHPLRPTDGFHSRIDGEFVGLGGHRHYASLSYLNSLYHPFGSKGYFRVRADFKFLQPFDRDGNEPVKANQGLATIPLDERYFLGGDTMVRGYRPYAIGPKFYGTTDPQGGLSLAYLSLEYDWQLFSRADLFLFADAGSLSPRTWTFGYLNCSAGYGAKLQILDGAPPLVLGMGYPLNAREKGDVKRFFISLGAKF